MSSAAWWSHRSVSSSGAAPATTFWNAIRLGRSGLAPASLPGTQSLLGNVVVGVPSEEPPPPELSPALEHAASSGDARTPAPSTALVDRKPRRLTPELRIVEEELRM